MNALLPENETDRLAALLRYDLLDTQPEPCFDRLTRIAAAVFATPISLVSLVDGERQFFKSRYGLDLLETHRNFSFCAHAILHDGITTALDATQDSRFADNPLVLNNPNIRFYAAAPLRTSDGFHLGTICVIDSVPRSTPEPYKLEILRELADQAVELMELRKHKQDINKAQQRAMQALVSANMGYWERDAQTDVITFSPLLEDMLGIEPEQYDGSVAGWLKHVHPDDRQMIVNRIEEARRSGENYTMKYRSLTNNGAERWITTTGTYRKDASGKFAGAYGVSWDSTASHLAERRLRMSEELFRALSNLAPVGIFRSIPGSDLVYVNPVLCAFNGVPEEELLGRRWFRFVHPDDRDKLRSLAKETRASQSLAEFDHRIVSPDGRLRWVHVKAVPLQDHDGAFVGHIGTVDDVTELRQTLDDLRKAKETAEVANRAKDMFLANISHELRTPLNGVLGMSELLMDAGLNEGQMEMAGVVWESARGLLSVVNDMLDLSRIEAGRFHIASQPFNLLATIQQTVSLFKAEASSKGLRISVDYSSHVPETYVGDGGRIKQILTNYVSNAIKFTSSGEIRIEVSGQLEASAVSTRITVRDSGVGIDAADQQKLFRPFSQVDSSSTRRNGGAGLGLAICKRLAELMHGTVGMKSALGSGSSFWVQLPLTYQATPDDSPSVLSFAGAHNKI